MTIYYLALLGRIILLGVERILVKKLGTDEDSASATFIFLGLANVFLFPFLFIYGVPPFELLVYPFSSGFIYCIAFFLYVKSLSIEEASLVSPLYNFNLFFLLIISGIFLGEQLNLFKIAGIVLLFYGAAFLNKQGNLLGSFKALFTNKACLMMIGCSVLVAVGRVIDGFSVQHNIPPVAYTYAVSLSVLLYGGMYIAATKRTTTVVNILRRKTKIALASGGVNAYSYLLIVISFVAIDVSIAEPASMLSMIVTVILSKFIFGEEIKGRIVGVAIMIAGTWLLFIE